MRLPIVAHHLAEGGRHGNRVDGCSGDTTLAHTSATRLGTSGRTTHTAYMSRPSWAVRAGLAIVFVVGAAAVVWSILLPTDTCVRVSIDYGSCSDNTALKLVVGLAGAAVVVGSLLVYGITSRRHLPTPDPHG